MQLHQSIVGHTRNSITAMNVGYGTVFTGSSKGIQMPGSHSSVDIKKKVAAFPVQITKFCIPVVKLVLKIAGIGSSLKNLKKCPKILYFGKILADYSCPLQ